MKDKMLGCIIGGACGDALGYPVEFMSRKQIICNYGPGGIMKYDCNNALISDDTQMTLFTIDGLLKHNDGKYPFEELDIFVKNIYKSYQDWLATQKYPFSRRKLYKNYDDESIMLNCRELFDTRVPGNTCLLSLYNGIIGSIEHPINDSSGCGGVMRVAPIGLFLNPKIYNSTFVGLLAAETAASTHGNEMGYIPAAMLALIISELPPLSLWLEVGASYWLSLQGKPRSSCGYCFVFCFYFVLEAAFFKPSSNMLIAAL